MVQDFDHLLKQYLTCRSHWCGEKNDFMSLSSIPMHLLNNRLVLLVVLHRCNCIEYFLVVIVH